VLVHFLRKRTGRDFGSVGSAKRRFCQISLLDDVRLKKTCLSLLSAGLLFAAAAPAYAQETPPASPAPAPAPCQYVLGFKTLHDMTSSDVGDCVDSQGSASNGDAQQHTSKGLLVWRKADNWTAFTNGYMTWLNGPTGLVKRLNNQRFPWEADYNAAGVSKIVPPPPALAANGKAWTVAFDHNLVLPGIDVDDGHGHVTQMPAKGKWVNIYFRIRNNGAKAATPNAGGVTLGDSQGRSYVSDFELRQVNGQGQEVLIDNGVAAGDTVLLRITLDVAKDSTGGVLHVAGGNDIAAL
jgi:hypothetical protein